MSSHRPRRSSLLVLGVTHQDGHDRMLMRQLATAVRGVLQMYSKASGGSSGWDQIRGPRFESKSGLSKFFIAPLSSPSTKWANNLRLAYAKNNQDPTPGSPMLGLSVGLT
ncbi:hypothetical protein PoB_004692700 [Plakobranchus ocellatus]|uniref:Uncharacterized protein n=1 Tax=Plakobranchus ocellatus TaxID=259542 RepID=A0AAV4BM58_9GAST|nr:hypothetical protein PoB_004692700 [Plakobranchus ocellatus]